MDPRDGFEKGRNRRRVLLFLLLLLLVLVGAGVGGFVFGFVSPDDEPNLSIDVNPDLTPIETTTPPVTSDGPGGVDGGGTTVGTSSTARPSTTSTTPIRSTSTSTPPTTVTPSDPPPPPTPPATTAPPSDPPTSTPSPTTRTPTTTPPPEDGPLDLGFEGDRVFFDYEGVEPGDGGTETIVLGNTGEVAGNLSVPNISVVDRENGIVEPEAAVDDSPSSGELSEHLRLSITVTYPDGTTLSVFGTGDGRRSVAELAAVENRSASRSLAPGETATVTVDWVLPSSTGNVVQSDGITMDVTFALRNEG